MFFLAQQAVEKIDRTRGHAAQLFAKLLTSPLDIPHIPRKNEVLLCFPEKLRQPGKVIRSKYYKHLKKCHLGRQKIKNGLVSGRLACTSSKTEILNKIGI